MRTLHDRKFRREWAKSCRANWFLQSLTRRSRGGESYRLSVSVLIGFSRTPVAAGPRIDTTLAILQETPGRLEPERCRLHRECRRTDNWHGSLRDMRHCAPR